MDPTKFLEKDHRAVETLFKKFERAPQKEPRAKRKILDQIIEELSLHATLEEQVFYPAVRAATGEDDLVLESIEEHDLVKGLLQQLEKMQPEEERFEAKASVLFENVRHHVKEEEGEMFPKVRKALAARELEELGERVREGKEAIRDPKSYLRKS
jgi:hemerythrin superfamily protein